MGKFDEQETKGAEVEKKETTVDSVAKESDIRYVNTDSLWENYEFIKKAKAELESSTKQMQSTFDTKIAAFQKEVESFQKDARYMTREQGQKKQQQLVQKEQELGKLQEDLARRMSEKRNELNKKIREKITSFLEEYNEDKEYHFILSYAEGGTILDADEGLDITDDVIQKMNEAYFKESTDTTETKEEE